MTSWLKRRLVDVLACWVVSRRLAEVEASGYAEEFEGAPHEPERPTGLMEFLQWNKKRIASWRLDLRRSPEKE